MIMHDGSERKGGHPRTCPCTACHVRRRLLNRKKVFMVPDERGPKQIIPDYDFDSFLSEKGW